MHETTRYGIDPIHRPRDVARWLAVSRPTLWRMVKRGDLPAPIRISRGAVGWKESTIRELLEEREAAAQEVARG